jgi:hypothetical protein
VDQARVMANVNVWIVSQVLEPLSSEEIQRRMDGP